jgi:hypothetical protein
LSQVPSLRPAAEDAERTAGQVKDSRSAQGKQNAQPGSSKKAGQLSDADQETLRKLKARDTEVRAHEAAHAAAGGSYAGAPSFSFQRGPDGRNYAIGGEVPIDVSSVPGDPQATITKMMQVQRAALAPQEPSGPDRAIAAMAANKIVEARSELMKQGASGKKPSGAADDNGEDSTPAGAFAALQRRSASVVAYSAATSGSGAGGAMDRHA